MLHSFLENFLHNLFKPLLLFFYFGFLLRIFKVDFEFPYVIYQGLTMYLLIAIGWHGGEELAEIKASSIGEIVGFLATGFVVNFVIGVLAYLLLSRLTALGKWIRRRSPGITGRTRQAPSPPAWPFGRRGAGFRRLHAGHVGGDGDPRVPGRAVSGGAAASSGDGRRREHAGRARLRRPGAGEGRTRRGHQPGLGAGSRRGNRGAGPVRAEKAKTSRSRCRADRQQAGIPRASCCGRSSSIPDCVCSSAASSSASSAGCRDTKSLTTPIPCSSRRFRARCACSCSRWA